MIELIIAAINAASRQPQVKYAEPVGPDYSDVLNATSDNNKQVAMMQIQSQDIGLQQASIDRQSQLAVNTQLSLEKLDTKMQVALLEYRQQMVAQENQHREAMASMRTVFNGESQSYSATSTSSDIPIPDGLSDFGNFE